MSGRAPSWPSSSPAQGATIDRPDATPFLLPLRGAIKRYAWGSRTVLARLRGDATPTAEPEAELWIGAHRSGPAQVPANGDWEPLDQRIARDPDGFLGAPRVARLGAQLPFLLKVLAIERPLSLQVHPNRGRAAAGFARERAAGVSADDASYPDGRHKPELIVALEPLWLLRGLVPPDEIRRRFAAAGIAAAEAETERLVRLGEAGIRDFLGALLGVAGGERTRWIDQARGAGAVARASEPRRDPVHHWLGRLLELHPEDPAALAPLFMHVVELAPGQALFQSPGVLHSYLEGVGVEVMASSDDVVRAGLTGKTVDVAEALAIADLAPAAPSPARAIEEAPGVVRFEADAAEFELRRLLPRRGTPAVISAAAAPVLGICTRGAGKLEAPERAETIALARGGAWVARAGAGRLELESDADGELDVFVASIPGGESR